MKITMVNYEETLEEDFKAPAKWFFQSALGLVYIHCRKREDAIQYIKDEWGGKYSVRCSTLDKGNGKESAVGRINSRSRAGMRGVSN